MSRVALVTRGSRGIGASISIALKEAGYTAASYAGNDEAAAVTEETVSRPINGMLRITTNALRVLKG